MKIIYLDNAATTPVYKSVQEAVKGEIDTFGNPSEHHILGERAREVIDNSRKAIASLINAKSHEIVFTSGATESNNMIVNAFRGKKMLISAIEHSSIYAPAIEINKKDLVFICVNSKGLLDIAMLEKEISEECLVSIIHVNNELGVIQDILKIGEICKKKKAYLHVDAAQSFGKLSIDVKKMNIDFLTASAHKIGGLKGSGILYIREGLSLHPLLFGGKQERHIRPGTENFLGILSFENAIRETSNVDKNKIGKLRKHFATELVKLGGYINGDQNNTLYSFINVSFNGYDSEILLSYLNSKGIICSSRSACNQGDKSGNRILRAIGLSENTIKGSFRIALNENTSRKDIDYTLAVLKKALQIYRA